MELALVLLGAIFVTYGWYWGGITEARTTAYAVGATSLILAFTASFQGASSVTAGSLVALGAVFGLLAAANAWNESAQDRTYGLFALFFVNAQYLQYAKGYSPLLTGVAILPLPLPLAPFHDTS